MQKTLFGRANSGSLSKLPMLSKSDSRMIGILEAIFHIVRADLKYKNQVLTRESKLSPISYK